jgi:DNA-binding XRE family transcriptional regulator
VSRRRAHLALLPQEFDPSRLPTRQLEAYNLACRLVKLPGGREGGVLLAVQSAFNNDDYQVAVDTLAKYLEANGLAARGRQKFAHARVAALRELSGVTQQQLAAAIGASPAQISQIENGKNFAIHRLLCICDYFEKPPVEFRLDDDRERR